MQLLFHPCPHCGVMIGWCPDSYEIRCPCCYKRLDAERLLAQPMEQTPDFYKRLLHDLDIVHYEDVRLAVEVAQYAVRAAESMPNEEAEMQAGLIWANAMMRRGNMAEAGLHIRRINAWSSAHNHAAILSRSHRLLASFFFRLGDGASALEHALHSLEDMPEDTHPVVKGKNLMALALALEISGEYDEAQRRFLEILDICTAAKQVQLTMYTLNNMAYSCYKRGEAAEASRRMEQLLAIAEQHDIPLALSQLDTISRIELLLGRPDRAERTMQPILDRYRSGRLSGDSYTMPDCFLTVAETQRLQGHYERAQATLNEACELSVRHGLKGSTVRARLEQARLYAAVENYKGAYEEHCRYHQESEELRSAEREARARILQTVFETEEARRSSEHFREMAQRDPLTGLYNRRFMDNHIDSLLSGSDADQEHTILLIDLDYFKRINDTMSHKAGDAVLVQLAKILTAAAVEPAKAARLGGEEFLIYCPGYSLEKGLDFAERLCAIIRSTDWSPITGSFPVTASIGVATARAGQASRSDLITEADRNLYKAKNAGRNRVMSAAAF